MPGIGKRIRRIALPSPIPSKKGAIGASPGLQLGQAIIKKRGVKARTRRGQGIRVTVGR